MSVRAIPSRGCEGGFTMIETLVATALTLVLTGAAFSLVNPRTAIGRALPEAADMQQRARVAADTLTRDLLVAGAGVAIGPDAGPLAAYLPPVVPRRMGRSGADPADLVRADAITITWVLAGAATAITSVPIAPAQPTLSVNPRPGCPLGDLLCGLAPGADALVFDDQAHFDVFRIVSVQGGVADLVPHDAVVSHAYSAGARVASAATRTYYLDAVSRQLRMNDGYLTDAPVVDNVVGLTFSYFGDPNPPAAPKPAPGTANCLYDAEGQFIGGLALLAPNGGSLAPLPLSMLNDGPWCGENNARFDADLLRVRRIRVTLRVQAGPDVFRAAGPRFAVPGTSRRADQALPDYVVTFDVAPRNMAGVAP